ncbi:hypothetical protein CLAIMM_04364 isoform 2 [Cladophialophora immunda]|nr:hypothetical protein CLAIMM_04364 isoform 2 [Cladophialophora immunda]
MTMAAAEATAFFQSLAPIEPDPVAVTDSYKDKDNLAYYMSQIPLRTPRRLKVIISGCGLSGISFAHEVNQGEILQNVDLTIYEKDAGIGGTWYENRYPGCACDIPVHNYQFAWAPYPYFSSYYASSAEICRYLNDVADQFDLRKYIHTCHKVVGARWDEQRCKWTVTVQRLGTEELPSTHSDQAGNGGVTLSTFEDECDVFINATGFVNDWKWPAVPNRESYQGRILHSAAWPKEHQSFEILPAILDEAQKVYVFIRNPTWVTAGFASKYAGPDGTNIIFTEEQKEYWANNLDKYYEYRKGVEAELNNSFRIYMKHSAEQQVAKDFATKQMTTKLAKKPELIKLLLPEFAVGCRRATPGIGYLEALASDKVEVVWGEIDSFTKDGLRSASGKEVKVDSIICATGFNVGFAPRFPVLGRNNVDLQEEWKENPKAYLSVTTTDMPNYFVYNGPASAIGHGSLVSSIDIITDYIADLVRKMQTENYGL